MRRQSTITERSSFIGIDYHKRYSVFCVLDSQGGVLERGRIDHLWPEQFIELVRRWPGCRVVFEACMNWHWLLEILEEAIPREDIVLANAFKTRIIAEAQINRTLPGRGRLHPFLEMIKDGEQRNNDRRRRPGKRQDFDGLFLSPNTHWFAPARSQLAEMV